jgi:hypothetical protein
LTEYGQQPTLWTALHLFLGAACLIVGGLLLVRPRRFLAFHERRGRDMSGYPSKIMGILLVLISLTQFAQALG